MSKFSMESESESSSSEEEQGAQGITFDEEEDIKRVVRSAREERYEELTEIIKLIKNYKKIKDMSKLLTCFENLTRAFVKARPVIEKEEKGVVPKFYIRCLMELEDFITECWEDKEEYKNMSMSNSLSLATLRQKIQEYNKDFEADITNYRANPTPENEDRDDDDEDLESDEESEDEKPSDFLKKTTKAEKEPKVKQIKGSDEESDEDSIDWGSSSDEESSLSTDDEKYCGNLATKFLKRAGEKDETKEMTKREKKRDKEIRELINDEGWEKVKGGAPLVMVSNEDFCEKENSGLIPLEQLKEEILQDLRNPENLRGTQFSKFHTLNPVLGGHREGEITLLCGHSGTGKTTLMCDLSLDLLKQGVSTLWGSFELKNKTLLKILLTQLAGEKLDGNTQLVEDCFNTLSNLPLFILNTEEFPKRFSQQKKIIQKLVTKLQIKHLIVDNLQYLSSLFVSKKDKSSLRRQDIYYHFFREVANLQSCHVSLICHPVKVQDYCQLSNAAIGGTSRVVQDSDSVLILQTKRDKTQYLELTKNRYSGIRGKFKVAFNAKSLSYVIEEFNE